MARILLSLVVLLAGPLAWALQERAPGVQRLQFEIEVDVERARQVGWTMAEEAGVVGLASRIVQERLVAMERAAQFEVQPGTKRFRLSLPSLDERDSALVQGLVRSLGVCEFLFVAGDQEQAERPKLERWRAAHPDASLEEFNVLEPGAGGPADGLAWFPTHFGTQDGKPVVGTPTLVRLPGQLTDHIGAADFARSYPAQDQYGFGAIGFEVIPARVGDFSRVTEANLHERMAIVLDGRVRSTPNLNSKLSKGGLIEGRFAAEEIALLTASVSKVAGPLRVVEKR